MKRVDVLFARNQAYKQIKEKVVGETVKYQPVYLDMIRVLSENHLKGNEKLRNIVINKTEKIYEIALHYQHFNLRTFLFFLSKVSRIYDCLKEHPHTVENMIEYIFLMSVKHKMGCAIEEWTDGSQYESRSLYGFLDFRNRGLAFRFVDDFILYGKFNSEEIVDVVTQYEIFERKSAEEQNDPANRIQNWWHMEEATLHELLEEVLKKMENNGYSFDAYLHILNNFVSLVSIGFDETYLTRLMDYMKNNFLKATGKIEIKRWHSSFAGDKDRELYAIKSKELNDAIVARNTKNQNEEFSNMLFDVSSWGIKIGCYVSEHKNIIDNSFISKIDANRILDLIEESDAVNIESFRYALSDFYSFSNIADYYLDDYPNLVIIYDGLNPDKKQYDLIKRTNIKWLKDMIASKIELLQPKPDEIDESEIPESDNSGDSSSGKG